MNKKICEQCGKEFEPNKFHPKQKFCCKKCQEKKWNEEHPEETKAYSKTPKRKAYKKVYDKKYNEEHKEEIKEYNKKYNEEHKEEKQAYDKKRYEDNPEKEKKFSNKYYSEHKDNLEFKEKKNVKSKKYYKEHPEERKEYSKKYYKEHPEQGKIYDHRRRTRKKGNGGSYTLKEIKKLRKESKGICKGYNKESHFVGEDKLTIDHIIPVIKGGTNNIENIQLLCKSCNSSKGTN